jgi:hypothetical protein
VLPVCSCLLLSSYFIPTTSLYLYNTTSPLNSASVRCAFVQYSSSSTLYCTLPHVPTAWLGRWLTVQVNNSLSNVAGPSSLFSNSVQYQAIGSSSSTGVAPIVPSSSSVPASSSYITSISGCLSVVGNTSATVNCQAGYTIYINGGGFSPSQSVTVTLYTPTGVVMYCTSIFLYTNQISCTLPVVPVSAMDVMIVPQVWVGGQRASGGGAWLAYSSPFPVVYSARGCLRQDGNRTTGCSVGSVVTLTGAFFTTNVSLIDVSVGRYYSLATVLSLSGGDTLVVRLPDVNAFDYNTYVTLTIGIRSVMSSFRLTSTTQPILMYSTLPPVVYSVTVSTQRSPRE